VPEHRSRVLACRLATLVSPTYRGVFKTPYCSRTGTACFARTYTAPCRIFFQLFSRATLASPRCGPRLILRDNATDRHATHPPQAIFPPSHAYASPSARFGQTRHFTKQASFHYRALRWWFCHNNTCNHLRIRSRAVYASVLRAIPLTACHRATAPWVSRHNAIVILPNVLIDSAGLITLRPTFRRQRVSPYFHSTLPFSCGAFPLL